MHKLSISHLQTVVSISESDGNITNAAHKLNLSQSALSHRLNEAEARLGLLLFERRNKKLTLSKAGKVLVTSAQSILKQLQNTELDIERMMDGIDQVLRISTSSFNCYHWFPKVLKSFNKSHPEVDIEIVADASLDPLKALKDGTIDLAITHLKPNNINFNVVELFEDEMVAIIPANHSLKDKSFLINEDFENHAFITNATTPQEGREYDLFFKHSSVQPKKILCAGHTEVIVDLVKEELGISILTRWVMKRFKLQRKIIEKQLTEKGIFIQWYAVIRKNDPSESKVYQFQKKLEKLKL
ncbi:LysR family transcriptional regulator [Thalassotalea fonticola]|uniref:LysR family transcriptional regulator n=1 Tax=Thalassotalea fonticola TaxID=3065649 RepID=A0ABZ0GKA1_9GAMM|nr:LysR family transcriptional regulator [Colwelliaceae bacterium S1-1]